MNGNKGVTVKQVTNPLKLALARRFRRQPTAAETELWSILRGRRMLGLKFRRQQVIDGFVVDFYCAQHELILEVDGDVHSSVERARLDQERTRHFEGRGLTVLRLPNQSVSPPFVRRMLAGWLKGRVQDPVSPSPVRERGWG